MAKTAIKTNSIYGVHPGVLMTQKWIAELKQKTGRSLDEWIKFIKQEGPPTEAARRDWLKLCAASIADQQGVTFEHIVQDAGTGPELEAWAAGRPFLKLYVEKDAGMYDAVNRGLERAIGCVLVSDGVT